jgi:hypothetical protein
VHCEGLESHIKTYLKFQDIEFFCTLRQKIIKTLINAGSEALGHGCACQPFKGKIISSLCVFLYYSSKMMYYYHIEHLFTHMRPLGDVESFPFY